MYRRILVPLDGSEHALAAVGPARRLARLHGAQLWLVTVATPTMAADEAEAIVAVGRHHHRVVELEVHEVAMKPDLVANPRVAPPPAPPAHGLLRRSQDAGDGGRESFPRLALFLELLPAEPVRRFRCPIDPQSSLPRVRPLSSLIVPRRFFPVSRFSRAAAFGFVGRRTRGFTNARRTSAISRSRAARRFCA